MWRAALKSILSHKLRLLTTSSAVLLGVAFMAGTFVLTDTMGRTFDDLFADVSANVDAVVRAEANIEVPFGGTQRDLLPQDLVDAVRAVDGVAAAEAEVEGAMRFVDGDGEPIGNPQAGAPSFGLVWPENAGLNPTTFVEGRPPESAGEVVVDKGTADAGDFEVGDVVTAETQEGAVDLTLVGIVRFGSVDSPGGANIGLLTFDDAQKLLIGGSPELSRISVVAEPELTQEEIVTRLTAELSDDVEVITGAAYIEENQDAIAEGIGFFRILLLVFAGIAVFVACFIIYNTFTILVAQRTRELALLRAVGASRRQVLGSVLLEAAIVGLVSALVGLAVGIALASGLKAALGSFGIDIPATGLLILPRTVVASFLVGIGVTVVVAVFPARRAASIPPIAALRDVAIDRSSGSRRRRLIGLGTLVLGGVVVAVGLSDEEVRIVGAGLGLVFVAVAILGPHLAGPVTRVVGWPVARLRGTPGHLARENAVRNPRRTASTAAALTIGVTLVSVITLFAQSAKTAVNETVDEVFVGDFIITSTGGFLTSGLQPDVAQRIDELPEVDVAAGFRIGVAEIEGEQRFITAAEPLRANELFRFGVVEGDLSSLGAEGIAVDDEMAASNGWTLGTVLPVRTVDAGEGFLEVRAIYTEDSLIGPFFLGVEAYDAGWDRALDAQVVVRGADDASLDEVRAAIEPVLTEWPTAELQDLAEFKEAQAASINQLLNVILVLLFLAVLIALMGIANTLALSVVERTREIGLIRAVGATRAQIRRSIRWEAVLIALFGTALGLILGVLFAWALVESLESEGFRRLDVPVGQLALIVVVAAAAGVLAALLPARRAARLDILEAISTE